MKIKEKLLRELKHKIEQIDREAKNLEKIPVDLFQQAFPDGEWHNSWAGGLVFTLPYNFQLIEIVKAFVQDQFPEFELYHEHQNVWGREKEAGYFLYYRTTDKYGFGDSTFEVAFRTGRDGTTCVLNQIGTEEVPVFEVTCEEGAKENW